MATVEEVTGSLKRAKFREDTGLIRQLDQDADHSGLRDTGDYKVHGAYKRGDVVVVVEQNTSPNPFAPPEYRDVAVTHPPVAVVEGPGGVRVAVDVDDHDAPELLARIIAELSGEQQAGGFLPLLVGLGPLALVYRGLILVVALLAGVFVDAYKKKLLDAAFGNTAVSPPATMYFGLSTTTPTEAGGNITEPSGNAYARVAKTNDTTNFPGATTADPSVKGNGTVVTFPAATGSWGTVTHSTNHDALTAGNPVAWQALTASQAISTGTTASYAANAWQETIT